MGALDNRVCVVTGGSKGIGRATVAMLLNEGARVLACSRGRAALDALEAELGNDRLLTVAGSVASEDEVRAVFEACDERFGPVEVLVNNAGLGRPTPDLAVTALSDFEVMLEVNLRGLFLCSREACARMLPRGRGHLINIVSVAGSRTNPTAPLYCASKFGARGLSSGLADQVLARGLKVTDINPGATDTDYWGDRPVPRERMLRPADVAEAIRFALCLPDHVLIRQIDLESQAWLTR